MREIIYRGKSVKTGEWVFGCYQRFSHFGKITHCIKHSSEMTYEVIPETVGQLACRVPNKSMYVDNSFNLFEGDLFKVDKSDTIYQVKWDGFGFYGVSNEGDEYGAFTCDLRRAIKVESFELVGNIHDNPELIKK